jgi:hypothetical protein
MKEINFIITVYNRENYWPYLKNILDNYKKIKSNYVICYSGDDDNFYSDFKIKNVINGGRGNNHHASSTPYVDMDYDLIIGGYNILKNNNVTNWIKLSVDSWLLDEIKIIEIFDFLINEDCVYAGNNWYSNFNKSTDIFFANTKNQNILEDFKKNGKEFLNYLYNVKNPSGLERLMNYIIEPYNYAIITNREPIDAESTRWLVPELGWCMSHNLETNIEFFNTYASIGKKVTLEKVKGNLIPYNFDYVKKLL